MGKIKLLDKLTISQIAAGEVVERPASAIKELVENSIDSGADRITVKISGNEFESIIVEDNGKGIEIDDLDKVFLNHATSKLNSVNDLESLDTMGFRGEAIASITAVSERLIIQTKNQNHSGARAESSDVSVKPIIQDIKLGATNGTTVEVIGLFNKTPARKKFLKSYSTEAKAIEQTFINTVLPYTNIHFELFFDQKKSLILPKTKSLQYRISDIFGHELSRNIIYKEFKDDQEITMQLYIANPSAFTKNKKIQYSFINNRFVKTPIIHSAITKAMAGLAHRDLSPIYFLNISINPSEFDINVHPRKLEVKFKDEQRIFLTVLKLAKKALEDALNFGSEMGIASNLVYSTTNSDLVDNFKHINGNLVRENNVTYSPRSTTFNNPKDSSKARAIEFNRELFLNPDNSINKVEIVQNISSSHDFENTDVLQVLKTYIVFEHNNELLFIDQHAAAEKIFFEKLVLSIDKVISKPLLTPIIYSFRTANDKKLFMEQIETINKLGFEISDFESQTIKIDAIPEISEPKDIEEIIDSILNTDEKDFSFMDNELQHLNVTRDQYMKLATIACHSSVRAGQKLSNEECREIIRGVMNLKTAKTCPHGRPIIQKFSSTDLVKIFRRDM